MGKNPSWFSAEGGGREAVKDLDTRRFPVENVSWDDAVEFCRQLSALAPEKAAGRVYRLPTEAEWEYACRSGTTTPFHFGVFLSSSRANFDGNYPYGHADKGPFLERTTRVGSFPPNAFQLHDMHGNVWQWCADYYDKDYYTKGPGMDPRNDDRGPMGLRLLRGGAWDVGGRLCRAAYRHRNAPNSHLNRVGFRVACTILAPPS